MTAIMVYASHSARNSTAPVLGKEKEQEKNDAWEAWTKLGGVRSRK
jgi:hypothetical protein